MKKAHKHSKRLPRRQILQSLSTLAGAGMLGLMPGLLALAASPDSGNASLPLLVEFRRLVVANRILANENVVDAFGHVSARHPDNPEQFVTSRSRSPVLVEHDDLMVFDLEGIPLDPRGRRPYGERMIHAAIC